MRFKTWAPGRLQHAGYAGNGGDWRGFNCQYSYCLLVMIMGILLLLLMMMNRWMMMIQILLSKGSEARCPRWCVSIWKCWNWKLLLHNVQRCLWGPPVDMVSGGMSFWCNYLDRDISLQEEAHSHLLICFYRCLKLLAHSSSYVLVLLSAL